jgi:hypothetical protein
MIMSAALARTTFRPTATYTATGATRFRWRGVLLSLLERRPRAEESLSLEPARRPGSNRELTRAERCPASGVAAGGSRRNYRRWDRAWVSRALAASHIRPSSRSRAGLVGLEP